ncbi:hypothetical protein INN71_17040 [Nocardioides sp. ChNu-153]|uniref:hypothetical protein n=1 Tax=Nocardioides sp. ChNu-153 TaxID=2779364 RepID=UPI00264C5B87|nr:hypothetical protein [Nocardioides sp. ChNu-153]MDN7123091.1 hypothetical protein [Nocardioides sp. ChNu-153]
MTNTGETSGTARRKGWVATVVLGIVVALAPLPAPAAQAATQTTAAPGRTAAAEPAPSVEVLAVDEVGYGPGIDVTVRLRGWGLGPYSEQDFAYYRLALAAPGIEDVAATPEAVVSRGARYSLNSDDATRTYRLAAYPLDPDQTYALYVVPDGGRALGQAEAPITIDWAALEPRVAITAGGPVTVPYGVARLPITVQDTPHGSFVTVTGLPRGPVKSYINLLGDPGVTTFPADHVGTYDYTATLDVPDGAVGDGLSATGRVTIVPAATSIGTSFLQVPTSSATGRLRTTVRFGGIGSPPAPIAWKIYQGSRVVWSSGVLRVPPRLGDMVVRLPRLPRGSYQLVVGYGGTPDLLPSSATRTFSVR